MDIDSHPQQHHHQPSTSSPSSHPQPHSHSHSTTPQPQPQPQSHPSTSSQTKKSTLTNRPAGSKEAKKEADQEDSSDVRQPRAKVGFVSCDNCRRRKIRCIREEELEAGSGSGSGSVNDGPNPKTQYPPGQEGGPDLRCVQCKVQGKECRFDYVLKKPGPRT